MVASLKQMETFRLVEKILQLLLDGDIIETEWPWESICQFVHGVISDEDGVKQFPTTITLRDVGSNPVILPLRTIRDLAVPNIKKIASEVKRAPQTLIAITDCSGDKEELVPKDIILSLSKQYRITIIWPTFLEETTFRSFSDDAIEQDPALAVKLEEYIFHQEHLNAAHGVKIFLPLNHEPRMIYPNI